MSSSTSANTDICSKLGHLLNVPPISIELLPGDSSDWLTSAPPEHAPFLFIDRNLGVPHKLACIAYLESVAHFRRVRASLQRRSQPLLETDVTEALTSSSILLLVNPAHQSALNARKALVQHGYLAAVHDLCFTDALLTLREGAKQSILWHHRRWLLRRIYSSISPSAGPENGDAVDTLHCTAFDAQVYRAEFSVVESACEAYPRNYHAWAHRFLCAESLIFVVKRGGRTDPLGLMDVLDEEIARIRTWIERHVSDYSAMQYHSRLRSLAEDSLRDIFEHATELICAYPEHESPWLYLRGVASPSATRREQASLGEIRGLATRFLTDVEPQVRRYAIQCLAWVLWQQRGLEGSPSCLRRIAMAC